MASPPTPNYPLSAYGANAGVPPGDAALSYPPAQRQQPPAPPTVTHQAAPPSVQPPPLPQARQPYSGLSAEYPLGTFPAPPQPAPPQQQQDAAYPPSFPVYGGSGAAAAATSAPSVNPSHSSTARNPASDSPTSYPPPPVYSSYPPHSPHTPSPASQLPQASPATVAPSSHAYIPREATREEVADEAIAATSQHWVNTQLRREAERRYEQRYGAPPPAAPAFRPDGDHHSSSDADDGFAKANAPRPRGSGTAGASVASPFGPRRHVEFHVGSPRHVGRLFFLFFITMFGMLPLMSPFSFTVLLCGVVLLYISDYLDYHRTTIFILLGTAGVFTLSLLITNFHAAVTSFGPMLMIADLGGVLLIVVAAALQHFRWVQETFPNVLCALERLVFAVGPVVSLPLLLTTTTALIGSRYAPFCFFVVVCALHSFFYCPLKSSFLVLVDPKTATAAAGKAAHAESPAAPDNVAVGVGVHARKKDGAAAADGEGDEKVHLNASKGHAEDSDDNDGAASTGSSSDAAADAYGAPLQLNEQAEALIFSCLVLILPVAVYNCFQSNWPDHAIANLLNSLGLVSGAIAYFCISPVHSLWFLASPPDTTYSLAQQLEFDPLGLMDLVGAYRIPVLSAATVTGVHWGVYRLLTSRYAYLFSGLSFPLNAIVMLLAFYIATYVAIEVKKLIDVDNRGGDVTRGKYLMQRTPVLVGSCVASMLLCASIGAPAVFYFPCVLSVAAFNLFLTDRTNGGPMFTFTVFTSLLLLFWMYRTYSFIVVDLRVFGETTVVPTPVVAVSVLWSYVLGCMSFTLAFSQNKTPVTITMFLQALQITFVEHVLYSQREDGVYPALLVVFTSVVGVLVPYRMYTNEALPIESASLIASCYVAKFFTFLVEVTSAYYAAELEVHDRLQDFRAYLLTAEITGGWWVALYASYLVITFEIMKRRRAKRIMFFLYAVAALLLSLLTIRNVQRAAYEFVTQSYVAEEELPHIAAGTFCATFAVLTLPVWWRLQPRYPAVRPLFSVARGAALLAVLLLAIQPTRVMEDSVSDFDYDFEWADSGRYAAVAGFLLLIAARFSVFQRVPAVGRILFWLVTAALLALGITGLVQAAPSFLFYIMMLGLVFTVLLMVDVSHYREVNGTVLLVVYGLSVLMVPVSFLQFNRSTAAHQEELRYSADGMATLWDMYEQGSMRLLAVVVVMHLGLAVMLNCRLSGRPLLPRCKEINHDAAMSLGVVANFSTELAVSLLCALNLYGNDSEPALYVLSSVLLLLLVNDEVMFFGLHEHNFRYFPPAACSFALLWLCTVWNAWRAGATSLSTTHQLWSVLSALLEVAVTLPAQASLLVLLWKGRKMGSSPGFVVVGSVLLNVLCLLFVSNKAIQWMAIVGIFGQCARLFDTQLQPTTGPRRRRTAQTGF